MQDSQPVPDGVDPVPDALAAAQVTVVLELRRKVSYMGEPVFRSKLDPACANYDPEEIEEGTVGEYALFKAEFYAQHVLECEICGNVQRAYQRLKAAA